MPFPILTRRLLLGLVLLTSVSMLQACAGFKPSTEARISLPAIPAGLARCDRPVTLPSTALSRADVERLWARDRAALSRCGYSLSTLVTYYEGLAADLNATAR